MSNLTVHWDMKAWLHTRNSLLYFVIAAFAVMILVSYPLMRSAYKGKEKDFNDKLFQVIPYVEEKLNKSDSPAVFLSNDSAAVRFTRTDVIRQIDSFLAENEIQLGYVYAVGKLDSPATRNTPLAAFRTTKNIIWSSDTTQLFGLTDTRLRITRLGQAGKDVYFIKVFFPGKPAFLIRQLLPLIFLSVLSIISLIVCFVVLILATRKQALLAQSKEDFINNMTHELKTPLFTISVASKMLAQETGKLANEKLSSYANSIRQETERLNGLVDTILESAALEHHSKNNEQQILDVHEIIHAVLARLEMIREQQRGSILLHLHAEHRQVAGNASQLTGAFGCILDNAFKYNTSTPVITITTRNSGNELIISFADNGIGIDNQVLHLLFERFFRAHTGDIHNVKGYGIGLNFVKNVMKLHHGKVQVNSLPGKGSEFILILPYANGHT